MYLSPLPLLFAVFAASATPPSARSWASCRLGSSAEFSLAPSAARLCLGESNADVLSLQSRVTSLGPARAFEDNGVTLVLSLLPSEALPAPFHTSLGEDVLVTVEAQRAATDSSEAAAWLARAAPTSDSAWRHCEGDGIREWIARRCRQVVVATGIVLEERVGIAFASRRSGPAGPLQLIQSKDLLPAIRRYPSDRTAHRDFGAFRSNGRCC